MPHNEPAPAPSDAPLSLAAPFGLIGLAGGWLTADAFRVGTGEPVRWLLVVVTPIVAWLLGAYLTRRVGPAARTSDLSWARRGHLAAALLVLATILIAGVLNGVLIGMMLAGPMGMLIGVFFGVMCALPFIPALGAVLFAAHRIGRARQGSIVDASDRRAVWAATAAAIALASLLVPALAERVRPPEASLWMAAASSAVLAALLLADAVALVRVVKATRGVEDAVSHGLSGGEAEGQAAGQAPLVDLGLGDETRVDALPAQHAYRGITRLVRVVRGSREGAIRALRSGVALAALALAAEALLWAQAWGAG